MNNSLKLIALIVATFSLSAPATQKNCAAPLQTEWTKEEAKKLQSRVKRGKGDIALALATIQRLSVGISEFSFGSISYIDGSRDALRDFYTDFSVDDRELFIRGSYRIGNSDSWVDDDVLYFRGGDKPALFSYKEGSEKKLAGFVPEITSVIVKQDRVRISYRDDSRVGDHRLITLNFYRDDRDRFVFEKEVKLERLGGKSETTSYISEIVKPIRGKIHRGELKNGYTFSLNDGTGVLRLEKPGQPDLVSNTIRQVSRPTAENKNAITTYSAVLDIDPYYALDMTAINLLFKETNTGTLELFHSDMSSISLVDSNSSARVRSREWINSNRLRLRSSYEGEDEILELNLRSGVLRVAKDQNGFNEKFEATLQTQQQSLVPVAENGLKILSYTAYRQSPYYATELLAYTISLRPRGNGYVFHNLQITTTSLPSLGSQKLSIKREQPQSPKHISGTLTVSDWLSFDFDLNLASNTVRIRGKKHHEDDDVTLPLTVQKVWPTAENGEEILSLTAMRPSPYYFTDMFFYQFLIRMKDGKPVLFGADLSKLSIP